MGIIKTIKQDPTLLRKYADIHIEPVFLNNSFNKFLITTMNKTTEKAAVKTSTKTVGEDVVTRLEALGIETKDNTVKTVRAALVEALETDMPDADDPDFSIEDLLDFKEAMDVDTPPAKGAAKAKDKPKKVAAKAKSEPEPEEDEEESEEEDEEEENEYEEEGEEVVDADAVEAKQKATAKASKPVKKKASGGGGGTRRTSIDFEGEIPANVLSFLNKLKKLNKNITWTGKRTGLAIKLGDSSGLNLAFIENGSTIVFNRIKEKTKHIPKVDVDYEFKSWGLIIKSFNYDFESVRPLFEFSMNLFSDTLTKMKANAAKLQEEAETAKPKAKAKVVAAPAPAPVKKAAAPVAVKAKKKK